MGNIIVETECDAPEQAPSSGGFTSAITYDGGNLSAINFNPGLNLNTALSNLNDVIVAKCAEIDANTAQVAINVTNIATNVTDITTNATAIATLVTDDIGFTHPGIPPIGDDSIVDLSAESTLNGVLDVIIDEIGTLQGLDATLFSKYTDVQYYVNEWVISGFAITGSSTTPDVDLASGVAMNNGKELVVSGITLALTADRDNYIDLQFDGTYDVKTVAISAPAPALPTDENRFYRLRVDSGGNLTDTLDLRVNEPFVGTQVTDNTMPNAKLTDSGVTAATYALAAFDVNSKGIITSATEIVGTDNRLLRYDSGYATDSFIWDTGAATGFGTITPQEAISLANSNSLIIEAGIPAGVGSSLIAGGLGIGNYFFVLAALTVAGEGLISAETTQTTTGSEDIRITWTRLTGAVSYRLYIGTATGVYTSYIDISNPDTVSFDYDGTGTSAGSPPGAPNTAYSTQISNAISWFGQGVVIGTDSLSSSAILELKSTTRGLLMPRMTTAERDAIPTPAEGLEIYNLDTNSLNFYNGTIWTSGAFTLDIGDSIGSSTIGSVLFVGASNDLQEDNANFFWDDTNNRLGIGTTAPGSDIEIRNDQDGDTTLLVSNQNAVGTLARSGISVRDDDQSFIFIKYGPSYDDTVGTFTSDSGYLVDSGTITMGGVFGGDLNIGPRASGVLRLFAGANNFNAGNVGLLLDASQNITIPNGTLTINDYTLPAADGTATGFMQTDGAGAVSFTTLGSITDTATATGTISIATTTDTLMTSMTITPGAGDFLVFFSGTVDFNGNITEIIDVSIYVNGVQQAASIRHAASDGATSDDMHIPVAISGYRITAAAAQAVEIRWSSNNGNTIQAFERNLTLLQIT